jgi:hypothetical protein
MNSLTFKDRLELYKLAKKPRKEIRLQMKVITNGLNLPQIERCESKVGQMFKIHEVSKIEPQISLYA